MRGLHHKRKEEGKSLQQWAQELQKKAHVGDRRPEAWERMKMEQEDSNFKSRRAGENI